MKKPFQFDVMSLIKCCDCSKFIKLNVIVRKGLDALGPPIPGLRCNACHHIYEANRGHFMGKYGRPRTKLVNAL